jgi:hypothetical protein
MLNVKLKKHELKKKMEKNLGESFKLGHTFQNHNPWNPRLRIN